MQDFNDFTILVADMIRDFGTTGILVTQPSNGEYNTATGLTDAVSVEVAVQCIIMDRTLHSAGAGVIDKTLIQDGDKLAYVSPTALLIPVLMPDGILRIDPATDRFLTGNCTYGIVKAKVVDLSGDSTRPILFELYLRR